MKIKFYWLQVLVLFFVPKMHAVVSNGQQNINISWSLNDVTYIYPLPKSIYENNLLQLKTQALGGELLPLRIVKKFPTMSLTHIQEDLIRDMRVVAIRIDPCFPLPTPASCQKQIRMVWQPVYADAQGKITTVDVALHSFYVLNDEDFESLLLDLKQWKAKFSHLNADKEQSHDEALDIHPLLKSDVALKEFEKIMTLYSGEKNISRVTAMILRRMGDVWAFLGLNIKPEGQLLSPIQIPRLDKDVQAQLFFSSLESETDFLAAVVNPAPVVEGPDLSLFIENSKTFSENQLVETLKSSLQIENPQLFNPENMDCVNCHVAQSSREWIAAKFQKEGVKIDETLFSDFKYKNSKYNLENKSVQKFNTQQTRALGYFKDQLAVSQRVINESAEVADSLNIYEENYKQRKK
ncbi:MAG: hypothetical protein ACK41T_02425 [Pseudobdellovibrio sp.]